MNGAATTFTPPATDISITGVAIPAGSLGPVNITVTAPGGTSVPAIFTYVAVGATSLTVANGGGPLGDTYANGNLLTVVGGGPSATPAVLTVTGVTPGTRWPRSASPTPVIILSGLTNPVATTDSNGTALGTTFNLTIAPLVYPAPPPPPFPPPVTATIPGGAMAPSATSLVGTATNVTVAATKYTSTSSTSWYLRRTDRYGRYEYHFVVRTLNDRQSAEQFAQRSGPGHNHLQRDEPVSEPDNYWRKHCECQLRRHHQRLGNPSPTMTDYYNAFWTNQDNPVYTLTIVTTPMTWDVVTPATPGSPAIPPAFTFSFNATPGDTTMGLTNYVGNAGMFYFNKTPTALETEASRTGPYFPDSTTKITDISRWHVEHAGFRRNPGRLGNGTADVWSHLDGDRRDAFLLGLSISGHVVHVWQQPCRHCQFCLLRRFRPRHHQGASDRQIVHSAA